MENQKNKPNSDQNSTSTPSEPSQAQNSQNNQSDQSSPKPLISTPEPTNNNLTDNSQFSETTQTPNIPASEGVTTNTNNQSILKENAPSEPADASREAVAGATESSNAPVASGNSNNPSDQTEAVNNYSENSNNKPSPVTETPSQPVTNTTQSEIKKEVNFDNYSPDFDKSGSAGASNSGDNEGESNKTGTIIAIILIIIVGFGIWQTNSNNGNISEISDEASNVSVVVDDTKQNGSVTIVDDIKGADPVLSADKVKITAYYPKAGESDCSVVSVLEREVSKRYESNVVNTVNGLLANLSNLESSNGWLTSIPVGTYLKNVTIRDGHAVVKLSSALNNIAGSCMVENARLQITKTLLQFSYISSVGICVEDNCNDDEIMQP